MVRDESVPIGALHLPPFGSQKIIREYHTQEAEGLARELLQCLIDGFSMLNTFQ
jgi:hypothetical protein